VGRELIMCAQERLKKFKEGGKYEMYQGMPLILVYGGK
jgi:hypothetical protein